MFARMPPSFPAIYINKMGKNDHARLPSVNKNLFDKANCPAFIAVQKPRCRSNNSADERGLWRSTQTIHFPGCSAAETPYKVH